MAQEKLMRDVFVEELYKAITSGKKNIYFMNADLGALALDRFLSDSETAAHFITTGISEQNAVNVATGLALKGKIPYVYAMAPFLFARPFEQLKIASATEAKINIVGVGVGYGYAGDGPTHYATEDIGCMRTLPNVEIVTPCDTTSAIQTAKVSYEQNAMRYIRLDRQYLPDIYDIDDRSFILDGIVEISPGSDICLIATGVMVHRAIEVKKQLKDRGINAGVVDMYRINPFNVSKFLEIVAGYERLVTMEEHFRAGGIGELLAGVLAQNRISKQLEIICIDGTTAGVEGGHYRLEGWVNRRDLHELTGLDLSSIMQRLERLEPIFVRD